MELMICSQLEFLIRQLILVKQIFIKLLFLKNNVSKPMNRMCDMIGLLIILAEAMKLLLNIRKFYFCIIINFKNN